jgi:hypothetical protein
MVDNTGKNIYPHNTSPNPTLLVIKKPHTRSFEIMGFEKLK